MSVDQAQSAVSLSAFVVASIFAYRKMTETTTGHAPNTSHFIIGFGFVYIVLALIAQGAPELGGMLAILVATGDVLANGQPLIKDLNAALKRTA